MFASPGDWLLEVLAIWVAILLAEPLLELKPLRVLGRWARKGVDRLWRRIRRGAGDQG